MQKRHRRQMVAISLLVALVVPSINTGAWDLGRVVTAVATGGASEVARTEPVKAATTAVAQAIPAVAEAVISTAVAPIKATAVAADGLVQGKRPEDVWKQASDAYVGTPLRDTTHAGAMVVQGGAVVQESIYTEAENAMRRAGGDTGQQIAALALMGPRLQDATGVSASQYVDIVAKGGDPAMLVSIPLATALRQAYETHKSSAKPYSESIKTALRKLYPNDVVESARYTVGKVEITLPNLINGGQRLVYGHDYAVTIGDITVYNTEPESLFWIAHEVRHTVQYRELGGFEGFAWSYTRYSSSMESNADEWGRKVATETPQYANVAKAANLPIAYTEQLIARASVNIAASALSCERAGRQATVELDHWNSDRSGPCQVNLVMRDIGPDKVNVIYYARHDGSYCGLKATEFGERLRSQGWTCTEK